MSKSLVSADWLKDNLGDVLVVDAGYHLPAANRDAAAEFEAGHIKGAVRFDIDEIADKSSGLPHMLPSKSAFESAMRGLGIDDDTHVVVYDDSALRSAARPWWMLRHFGHARVSVLDGGLAAWRAIDGAMESGPAAPAGGGTFTAGTTNGAGAGVISFDELAARVADGTAGQILDARAAPRFSGDAPEPRQGLRSGHIPGARNLPFDRLLDDGGRFHDAGKLAALFAQAGIDTKAPVVTSCGSGVTACVLALAMDIVGDANAIVYDGSWTEYGASDAPIETGPAA